MSRDNNFSRGAAFATFATGTGLSAVGAMSAIKFFAQGKDAAATVVNQAAQICSENTLKSCVNSTVEACTVIIRACTTENLKLAASAASSSVETLGNLASGELFVGVCMLVVGTTFLYCYPRRNSENNSVNEETSLNVTRG